MSKTCKFCPDPAVGACDGCDSYFCEDHGTLSRDVNEVARPATCEACGESPYARLVRYARAGSAAVVLAAFFLVAGSTQAHCASTYSYTEIASTLRNVSGTSVSDYSYLMGIVAGVSQAEDVCPGDVTLGAEALQIASSMSTMAKLYPDDKPMPASVLALAIHVIAIKDYPCK